MLWILLLSYHNLIRHFYLHVLIIFVFFFSQFDKINPVCVSKLVLLTSRRSVPIQIVANVVKLLLTGILTMLITSCGYSSICMSAYTSIVLKASFIIVNLKQGEIRIIFFINIIFFIVPGVLRQKETESSTVTG